MNTPLQQNDRLAILLADIESAGGLISDEQETALAGFQVEEVINAILTADYFVERAKALEALIRGHRKAAEFNSKMLRSKATKSMQAAGSKNAKDPDAMWTASLVDSPGSVVLHGDISEVPALYTEEKVETAVNNELARLHLEANMEIKSVKTGLPILTLEKGSHVRILKTKKAKLGEIGADVGTLLGMSATVPAVSGPALKLVEGT